MRAQHDDVGRIRQTFTRSVRVGGRGACCNPQERNFNFASKFRESRQQVIGGRP